MPQDREKIKLLERLRKVRGQSDAVERSLTADEDCGGQLMLLAAVRGGVAGLMAEVLEHTPGSTWSTARKSRLRRSWPRT